MQVVETIAQVTLIALCVIVGIIVAEWTHREMHSHGRDTRSNDYRQARREEKQFRKQVKKTYENLEEASSKRPKPTITNV